MDPRFDVAGQRAAESRSARVASWAPFVYALSAICTAIVFWRTAGEFAHFFHTLRVAFDNRNGKPPAIATPTVTAWAQLLGLPSIAAQIALLVWQYRAARVARSLGYPARYSPGWGVALWFVPIVNLWMPYLAVRDLFAVDDPARRLLPYWWITVIAAAMLASAVPVALIFDHPLGVVLLVLLILNDLTLAALGRGTVLAATAGHRTPTEPP